MSNKKIVLILIVLVNFCIPFYSQHIKKVSELVDSVLINDSLANYYAQNGEIRKAQIYAAKNVAINSLYGKNTIPYAVSVLKQARYIYPNEREVDDKLSSEGLSIIKDSLGVKSSTYTKFLLEYAWRQFNFNRIQEACNIVKNVADEKFDGDEFFLGYLYYSYAHFLKEVGESDLAKTYASRAMTFFEEMQMYNDDYYLKTLTDLALLNFADQDVSISYLNKAKNIVVKNKGKNNIDYLDVLLNFSYIYRYNNQLEKALDYAIQAKNIGEIIKELDYSSYLYTLEYLSKVYSNMKKYNEAIINAEECLTLMKERKDIAIDERLPTLDSLVLYNWNISNIGKVNTYSKEAYLIRKGANLNIADLLPTLYYLSRSNYILGRYDECVNNINEIKGIYKESFSTAYQYYYDCMMILVDSYLKSNMYNEALEASNEMLNTFINQYGQDNKELAGIFYKQAIIYSYLGNYNKYHDYSLKALAISKKYIGENSPKYLSELSDLANHFYNMEYYEEAYNMFKEAAQTSKELFGENHIGFIRNYLSAMLIWQKFEDDLFNEYQLDNLYKFFKSQRLFWSFNHKDDNIWDNIKSGYYKNLLVASLPNLLKKYGNDTLSINAICNSLLLFKESQYNLKDIKSKIHKELSFKSEKEFDDFLTSNDHFIECLSQPDGYGKIDSLNMRALNYINNFKKNSLSFQSYCDSILTYDRLKKYLRDDEVVIDYISHSKWTVSQVDYILIIEKRGTSPLFIPSTNPAEQIKKTCNLYNRIYFLIDNDSIISNLNLGVSKTNCIFGYDLSIEKIINRNQNTPVNIRGYDYQSVNNFHADDFSSAYTEFERGVNLYNKKQYSFAIDAFLRSDSLMYWAKGEKSNYFGHGRQWIGSCYYKMSQDSIAKQYSVYYNQPPINMRLTLLSDSILDVAESLYEKGDIESSLNKYLEASEIEKDNLGEDSYWYANTLSFCAGLCKELGKYEKAIGLENKALNIRKGSPGYNHKDYYHSLKNMFKLYFESGNKSEIFKYGELLTAYMEKHKQILGDEYYYYPVHTYSLAQLYGEDNKRKALEYCKKTIESTRLIADYPDIYREIYHGVILTLKVIGEDSLAFELCKTILPIYEKEEKLQNNENYYFSDILNIMGSHYFYYGDFISACIYQEKALNNIGNNDISRYGVTISNLALTYCELDRLEDAIKLAEEAVSLCQKDTSRIGGKGYAKNLLTLANCYFAANRVKDALRTGKKGYELLKEEYGFDLKETIGAANNLSTYYDELGYNNEAIKLLSLVIEHAEKDIYKNADILGTAYNNLAMSLFRANMDFKASLKYIDRSYEIRKEVLGENNLFTIQSLYNKGRCLLDLGDFPEGIMCINNALKQTKSLIGEKNMRYVEMMKILPIIYGKAGNLKRAIEMEENRSELTEGLVGTNHISYIRSLENLSELYFYANDTLNLHKTIVDTYYSYRKMIISDFPNYTSIERANVVNGMGNFFDWLFPLVCYYKHQSDICSVFYNALLLRKGILLNSEIEFGHLIRESGNPNLINNYNELIANKNMLIRQYQLPIEQRIFDIDSLKHIIYEKEEYLVSASKEYGDFTKRFRTNWKDIREKLKDGELSVEFVEFNDTCTIKNRIYYALLVDKYSENPEIVPLCTEKQIQEELNSEKNTSGLYQLIWNPILKERNEIKTIFFSPSGILNNIGIEYIDISHQENISDKYALYRLSSTREILDKQEVSCKTAALYGGLNYSVDTVVLLAQNVKSGVEVSSSVMYRGLSDPLSVRNSFEPLYNTKTEIYEIGNTLSKRDVSVSVYSDTYGTEESFKALSGKSVNLIHLATHGMYIGASEAESRKRETNLSFIQLDENESGQSQEDKSLSRSFLVMSGGDMLPSHRDVPENLEDGILTALEISKMDLRGLDLVVLSACQTALGDVDNEGVYGLQRGFKKAGAKTILMSLDKVDDEATKILMVEFYKNLMSGKPKHQSLKDAQKHLRKIDNGKYNKPEYWASFIMLDGLN